MKYFNTSLDRLSLYFNLTLLVYTTKDTVKLNYFNTSLERRITPHRKDKLDPVNTNCIGVA